MNVVVCSGGMDSATALGVAISTGPTRMVSFDYGQRHRRELRSAADLARHYGVHIEVVHLDGLLRGSALLGSSPVPDGKYDHASMSVTVVPGRNLLFAAAAIAQARFGDAVWFGVHAGDHTIYPDCRPPFWAAMEQAAAAYDLAIVTPFLKIAKSDIVTIAAKAQVPLKLTWSCYKGREVHCGRCGTCVERAEAFHVAGVDDPTTYADPDYWREAVGAV